MRSDSDNIAGGDGAHAEKDKNECVNVDNEDHLHKESAWNYSKIYGIKHTFLNAVTSDKPKQKVNFRTLVNNENVENSNLVLHMESIFAAQQRFANSLVGYFVGKTVAFQLVKNYVTNTWRKFRFQKVIKDDDGFLLGIMFS
ncbi:hypothetical protein Tco_0326116 [Tanacetum coccineum]